MAAPKPQPRPLQDPFKEQAFQSWAQEHGVQAEAPDYDTRGAFLDGMKPDARGHLGDKFKLPNHITFSSDSVYHSPETPGGQWSDLGDGQWSFAPSPWNLKNASAAQLADYFRKQEPKSTLILPDMGFNLQPELPINRPDEIMKTLSMKEEQ